MKLHLNETNLLNVLNLGQTYLMIASQEGHTEIVDILLKEKAKVNIQSKGWLNCPYFSDRKWPHRDRSSSSSTRGRMSIPKHKKARQP